MPSSKEYLEFILEQLSDAEEITYRYMMGEYVIYYRKKVIGGIYDDRFLIKVTNASKNLLSDAKLELPYERGSKMILIEDPENKEQYRELFEKMYEELPAPKVKKKKAVKNKINNKKF